MSIREQKTEMRIRLACIAMTLITGPAFAGSIRNEKLYDRIVELRATDPDRFDGNYPFIGRLVSDDEFFDSLYDRWQSHPARFEHYHDPLLIRILDGGPRIPHFPPNPPPCPPPHPPCFPPVPPRCDPDPPPGVPEPGSVVMLSIGLGLIAMARRITG